MAGRPSPRLRLGDRRTLRPARVVVAAWVHFGGAVLFADLARAELKDELGRAVRPGLACCSRIGLGGPRPARTAVVSDGSGRMQWEGER